MYSEKRIAVVVPAHNEERLIHLAVGRIPSFVDQVVVVDDASTDGTRTALERVSDRPGLCYLRHPENRGVGGAIVSGYKRALELDAQVVAVMAGDAQMDPADLPKLLEPIVADRADYVKGDRLSWPGVFDAMPLTRFIGNHVLTLLTRYTCGYPDVRDSQCGFTAANATILKRVDLDALYHRYGFPNDLLAHLHSHNARVVQVPVRPIYGAERSGISVYTACVEVPRVLLRSRRQRLSRENRRQATVSDGRPLSFRNT